MEVEKIGDEFIDGRVINLDKLSMDECKEYIAKIAEEKEKVINRINKLLSEI